jgi:hypothetical protein
MTTERQSRPIGFDGDGMIGQLIRFFGFLQRQRSP